MKVRMNILVILVLIVPQPIQTKEFKMKDVLIVYSTFGGTTTAVVEAMKQQLENLGHKATVHSAKDAFPAMEDYDLIILGSSIRGNEPHEDMKKFVRNNIEVLKRKPTAVFVMCITITSRYESRRKTALTYPGKIAREFQPAKSAVFAGYGGDGKEGWFETLAAKWLLGVTPGKDYRDFERIKAWTASLVEEPAAR